MSSTAKSLTGDLDQAIDRMITTLEQTAQRFDAGALGFANIYRFMTPSQRQRYKGALLQTMRGLEQYQVTIAQMDELWQRPVGEEAR